MLNLVEHEKSFITSGSALHRIQTLNFALCLLCAESESDVHVTVDINIMLIFSLISQFLR